MEAEYLGRLQPRVQHVVGVADPGHDLAGDRAAVLDVGEDVGQHLARVVFVGQAVNHRHARMGGEALDDVLAEGAHHDDVAHAAHDLAGVFHRLAAAKLAVARVQVDRGAAQLVHAGFERQAGAGRIFLEHHHQRAVDQRVVHLVGLEFALDDVGALDDVLEFVEREVGELQEVLDRCIWEHGDGQLRVLSRQL